MNRTETLIALEKAHGAGNYSPVPVMLERGEGVFLWDVEKKRYFDFLSGIGSVSQGHCHPRIVAALVEQAGRLTMTSRAFYAEGFGKFARLATGFFRLERLLMMNTGVEAVETAIKIARKWGYTRKKIAPGEAKIIVCEGCFHGRTIATISAAASSATALHFGPLLPGFVKIPFGDLPSLTRALQDPTVAGFLVEPIQGEGGVVVPPEGYLKAAADQCRAANVLFMADEVQTGIGRTGKRLACDHEGVKPDILALGKSLSGGMFPVSAVLADESVMGVLVPGDHGSTFGGNPLACAVATAALEVMRDENLASNAEQRGIQFRERLATARLPGVTEVRGKGLLNAVVFATDHPVKGDAWSLRLKDAGILAKNTRENIIRFAPPLTIRETEMEAALEIIVRTLLT